jgi:hypothetical protein
MAKQTVPPVLPALIPLRFIDWPLVDATKASGQDRSDERH